MVSIFAPSASAARTTQLLTGTSFMMTVQAPQLPLLQPSLAPVRRSESRSASRRLCRGSQRNSAGWPLMVAVIWSFLGTGGKDEGGRMKDELGAGAVGGAGGGAFGEDAGAVAAGA